MTTIKMMMMMICLKGKRVHDTLCPKFTWDDQQTKTHIIFTLRRRKQTLILLEETGRKPWIATLFTAIDPCLFTA